MVAVSREFWDARACNDAGFHAVMTRRWTQAQCEAVHRQMQAVILQAALEYRADATFRLDLGCGTGNFLNLPPAVGATKLVLGVDLSHHMCLRAALSHASDPRVHVVRATVSALPVADATVSCALSVAVLQHLPDLPALHRTAAELSRVLAPGAVVILLEGTRDAHIDATGRGPSLLGTTTTTLFSVDQYRQALRPALDLVLVEHMTFIEDRYTCLVWRKQS